MAISDETSAFFASAGSSVTRGCWLCYQGRSKIARIPAQQLTFSALLSLAADAFPDIHSSNSSSSPCSNIQFSYSDEDGRDVFINSEESISTVFLAHDKGGVNLPRLQVHFEAGSCMYGPLCAFLLESGKAVNPSPSSADSSICIWRNSKRSTAPTMHVASSSTSKYQPRIPCKHFQRGSCRYGSSCTFLHESNKMSKASSSATRWDINKKGNLLSGTSPGSPSTTYRQSGAPCLHFQRGTCKYGSSCVFAHTIDKPSVSSDYEITQWLTKLKQFSDHENISYLTSQEGYATFLNVLNRPYLPIEVIEDMVKLFTRPKLRSSMLTKETNQLYNALIGSRFLNAIHAHIRTKVQLGMRSIEPYILLCEGVMTHTNDGWKEVPLDELKSLVDEVQEDAAAEAILILARLLELRGKKKRLEAVNQIESDSCDSNFRDLPIIPSKDQLLSHENQSQLPKIQVGLRYANINIYLDTHFRLMQEDFLASLRNGIHELRKDSSNLPRNTDIHVYRDVRMLGFSCSNTGMLCRISFKARGRKIDWSSAKRLMFGSLLCLSCDNFKTLLWAVVANRTAENLALEMVDLQLLEHSEQMSLDSNEVYVMAESSAAYFEAYLHVLKALQLPDLDELPFQEHFVALEPQVKEPIYLKQRNRKDVYDFETVFPNIRDELRTAQFHILEGWPAWENSLDASQLSALKHGLTKQLALIQGPPGTGKTFVGLLLVRVLINNLKSTLPKSEQFLSPCQSAADMEDTADGPILVVCYTNHALDQFLEGIYEHEEEIVRVGGRSKSPVLEGCSLQKLLLGERSWYNEELQSMNRKLHEQKQVLQREIEDCISLLNAEYVTKHALLDIASREQVKSLFYEQCDIINVVEVWFNERDRDTRIGHIQERYSQKQTEILSTQNPYEILQTESFQDVRQQIRNYDDFMSNNRSDGALKQHASNATSECSSSVSAEMDVHDEAEGTDVSERSGDEEIERSSKYSNCQGIGLPSGDMFEKSTSLYGVGSVDTLKVLESLGQDETQQMDLGRLQLLSAVPDESWTEVPKKKRGKHISLPTELQHVGTTTNKGDQEIDVNDLDMLKKHNDVWTLTRKARRVLHAHWLDVIRKDTREKLKKLHSDYDETCKRKQEVENEIKLCLMRKAKIVGMTTTAAARYHSVLACLKAQIVVIEEAAEVLESHILACITESTKHLIMIGDHLQLRPSVATYELALKHGLDVSLFERLVKGGVEYVTLEVQRRMRPSISTLISSIYPMLRDHESVSNRDKIRGMKSDVFFMHHTNPEEQRGEDDSGKLNVVEAQLIVELCAYLIKQQYSYDDITILSMYNGQVMEIKSRMARKLPQNVDSHPKLPRVSSVDDYQGEECKIIILSLVRNNCLPAPGSPGKIGFLSVSNRVCVSLSRARDGLFIFGNGDLLMKKSKLWEDVVKNLEGSNSYGDALILVCPNHPDKEVKVKNPEDFRHVPDGGCDQPCEYQLSCGHVCPKYCHPGGHDKVVCPKRCPRKHAACNHDCQAPCHGFEACPPCRVLIEKVLPQCGHSARISCSASIESVICSAPCPRLLECSHPCRRNCGMSCTTSCPQPVEKLLSCGHLVKIACHIDPSEYLCIEPCRQKLPDCMHTCEGTCGKCKQGQDHIPCLNKCNRTLPCGHRCSSSCHRVCPPCSMPCQKRCLHSRCPQICGYPCVPCMETCAWRCEHHACHLLCHKICKRPVCNVPCRKLLRCGHPCLGFCGEPCPFICRMCTPQYKDTISLMTMEDFDETDRFVVLPDCGHVFEVSGLDTWMQSDQSDSGTSSISPKSCPTCRIIIRQSARYGNRVKAGMQQLEEVKMRILGFHEVNEGISLLKTKKFDKALEKFSTALKTNRLNYEACLGLGSTLCFQFKYSESLPFFHRVVKHSSLRCYASELETSDTSTKWKTLEQHKLEALLETIDSDPLPAVVKAEKPLAIRALVQWGNALSKMGKFSAATRACEIVLKEDPGNKDAQNMLVLVKEGKQTQADVVAVLMKEVGGKGHWYKCPNGHYYVVGECGGPMQLSKCPDCQETVGGQNHKSAAGNTHSSIDGSSHSAWSDRTGFGGFPVL